jgi:hypothetical protein
MSIDNAIASLAVKNLTSVVTWSILVVLAAVFATPAFAQDAGACVREAEAKVALYQKFLANYRGTVVQQKAANESGKEYLSKYGNCPDEADKKVAQFVQRWLGKYEKAEREFICTETFRKKEYARTFEVCQVVLNDEPDNLEWLLLLTRAGYGNVTSAPPDNSLNADAGRVAGRAAKLIESGNAPAKWEPFASRDEALGFLYYAQGVFTRETSPADAAGAFVKAAQSNSSFKREPTTYTYLVTIYETNELKKLADEYNATFAEGQPIPDNKKAQYDRMLAQIERVQDRIIDALARAVSILKSDPNSDATRKNALMGRLTAYYKGRHQDSDAGLAEFIATVLNHPLPLQSQ